MTHHLTLRTHTESGIQTVLLNRPEKRNAITPQLMQELVEVLESAAGSPECRVVILTGAGSAFCAGLDLDHLRTMVPDTAHTPRAETARQYEADARGIAHLLRTIYSFPKPTIAAVNGAAIAGGMGIATLCDFTLAVPEAKFGYTEVRIGYVPAIVSAFLRTQLGDKRCRDLLLTGRLLSAEEACNLGLVTRVVPEPELIAEARGLARRLMHNSPAAMMATKRLLGRYSARHLAEDIETATMANLEARFGEDFREGVAAFLEKREPRWPSLMTKKADAAE